MPLFSRELATYLDGLVPPRESILIEMEERAAREGFPIIGPACGHACYQIARMISAKEIFELGSGFGYSTAWFAKAVQENGGGKVRHIVWDEALSKEAKKNLDGLGYGDLVDYQVGEAVGILKNTQGEFDLIFCDIDKEGYPEAIKVIDEKLKVGGVLIMDNMLWGGRIFDKNDQSKATQGIRESTGMLASNDKWINTIMPIRDGLLMALKVK